MAIKHISRDYLVSTLKDFKDALNDLEIGLVAQLETTAVRVVPAINEVNAKGMKVSGVLTFAEWSAPAIKDEVVDVTKTIQPRFYYIKDDFVMDAKQYHAGSIILASQVVTDASTGAKHYDWKVIGAENGIVGDLATLTTVAKNTVVAAIEELHLEHGELVDLETLAKNTFVASINELFNAIKDSTHIEDITYEAWSANDVRYQEVASTDYYMVKAYRITNAFTHEDKYYQAGSLIIGNGKESITTPVTRDVYKWIILGNEAATVGNLANLDTRVSGENTIVDVINHVLKDMEVEMVESAATGDNLKSYTIYQGMDTATRKTVGIINIPKDLVIADAYVKVADGTEVIGKDASGFDIYAEAGKRYMVFVVANKDIPIYILVEDFIKLYAAEENADQVQLAISGENIISATIVEDSISHIELDKKTEKELDFTGYDHNRDDATHADYGKPQLDTTAQNLRGAVNEHEAKIGDLTKAHPTVKTDLVTILNQINDNSAVIYTGSADDFIAGGYTCPDGVSHVVYVVRKNETVAVPGGNNAYEGDLIVATTTPEGVVSFVHINVGDKVGDLALLTKYNTSRYAKDVLQALIDKDDAFEATIGDITTLNDKLKKTDASDATPSTLVKASNLAYQRNILTVQTVTPADPTQPTSYIFKQDNEQVFTLNITPEVSVKAGEVITADGSEIIGKNDDGSNKYADAGKKYFRMSFENSEKYVFVDVRDLFNTARTNADKVQLAIDANQEISATIVPGSIIRTDLHATLQKELALIGYDHSKDTSVPPEKQLDTTAQTIRTAINEIVLHMGDVNDLKTTAQDKLVNAINEIEEVKVEVLTATPDEVNAGSYPDDRTFIYFVPNDATIGAAGEEIKGGSVVLIDKRYPDTKGKHWRTLWDGNIVGDLTKLTTDIKTSAVWAINEVDEHTDTNTEHIGDVTTLATTEKSNLVGAMNEVNTLAKSALHLVKYVTSTEFVATYKDDPTIRQFDAFVITNDFTLDGTDYKAGTWAYKAISIQSGATRTEWSYMNNGGGGDALYVETGLETPPTITTVEQMANYKPNHIYVFEDANGNKSSYMYVRRSETDPSQNYWLQISSGTKGIEWIGTYNYQATHVIIDPDTGERTEVVVEWVPTAEQLAGVSTWVYTTYGRQPQENDLVSLTIDGAFSRQLLFKNSNWQEYSSFSKATKAQYGVTKFATQTEYDAGDVADPTTLTKNIAVDPWLLRQILSHVATDDNIYTKAQADALYDKKADITTLVNDYYDKTTTDEKLKSLQKAYVTHTDPETMTPEQLEQFYGSLIYYIDDTDVTHTFICDSTGTLENLGTSGISLDGYVTKTDAKYVALADLRTTDAAGAALTAQMQIDGKQDKITAGALTTVLENDLIKNRVVISNANGKITQSVITAEELAMLDDINTTDASKTIELRLQALEAGGGAGGGNFSLEFVTALPTTDINVYKVYRLTTDNSYWIYDNTVWHRLDYDEAARKINGISVKSDSTSESLNIIRSLTRAEYDALATDVKNNGTLYCITDEGTSVTPTVAGVSSINGNTGAISMRSLVINGVTYPLIGDTTSITIPSGGGSTAAAISYTPPTSAASKGTDVQTVIDQLQARIAALETKVATLEGQMPTFTLNGTTLSITTP